MSKPDLGLYIQYTAMLPWAWGRQDCTIWVADWCAMRFGFDPAASFRGQYDDEAGALSLTKGGLLSLVEPFIALPRKGQAVEGDLGIIEFAGAQLAAIRSGRHWVFRKPTGVGFVSVEPLTIWGEQCQQ